MRTLRRVIQEKDAAFQRHTNIEKRLLELEQQGTIRLRKQPDGDIAIEALGGGGGGAIDITTGAPLGELSSSSTILGDSLPAATVETPAQPSPPPPPPPPPPLPTAGTVTEEDGYTWLIAWLI